MGFEPMSLGCCRYCRVVVDCCWCCVRGSRYRWVVVNVVGFSSMSLDSRLHRCTVHVDEWPPLPLTVFAVDGLDCSPILCIHIIRRGVAHFRVVLWLRFMGCQWGQGMGEEENAPPPPLHGSSWFLSSLAYSSSINGKGPHPLGKGRGTLWWLRMVVDGRMTFSNELRF